MQRVPFIVMCPARFVAPEGVPFRHGFFPDARQRVEEGHRHSPEIGHLDVKHSFRLEPGAPAGDQGTGDGSWKMLEHMMTPDLGDRTPIVPQRKDIGVLIRHRHLLNVVEIGWKVDVTVAGDVALAAAEMQF